MFRTHLLLHYANAIFCTIIIKITLDQSKGTYFFCLVDLWYCRDCLHWSYCPD